MNTISCSKVQFFIKNSFVLTSLVVFVAGCATPPAEYRRAVGGVREVNFAPAGCKEIGVFDGGEAGMTLPQAKEDLRFKVGKDGGNAVVFDFGSLTSYGSGKNSTVSGTGYKCAE